MNNFKNYTRSCHLQDVIDEINEADYCKQVISELAHYTSVEALFSILQSVSCMDGCSYFVLRATNALYTNDKEELKVGYNFLIKYLKKLEDGRPEKCQITNYLVDAKKSNRFKQYIETDYLNWFYSGQMTPYVISLSRIIDKVSMWKQLYGRGGNGVCLVLDMSTMEYKSDEIDINCPLPITYGKRIGFQKEKELFIMTIMHEYQDFLNLVRDIDDLDNIIELKLQAFCNLCSFVSSYFKSEKWHDEQEVRIMCMTKENNALCIKHDEKKRPYVNVFVPLTCLKRIIIGPTVRNEIREGIMSNALKIGLSPNNIVVSQEPLKL